MRRKSIISIIVCLFLFVLMCVPVMAEPGKEQKNVAYSFCMKDKNVILKRYSPSDDEKNAPRNNYHWLCYHTPALADDVKVTSSNPSVVEIMKFTVGCERDIYIKVKKAGKSVITVNAFYNGKNYIEKCNIVVKEYENPAALISVGKTQMDEFQKQSTGEYVVKKKCNKLKIQCTPKIGWKLDEIRIQRIIQKKRSVAAILSNIENGEYINLNGTLEVVVNLYFINEKDGFSESITLRCRKI